MSATTVRTLITKWGFVVDASQVDKMKRSVSELKTGIGLMAAEAAAAATALFGVAYTTSEYGKAAMLAARATGLSTEEYQKLSEVSKQYNLNSEAMRDSMARMNRVIYQAKTGSKEAAQSLKMFGSDVEKAAMKGEPTSEVFYKIADGIAGMSDPAKQTAAAMGVFGRSGFQMIPMLSEGSAKLRDMGDELEGFGMILNQEQIKEALDFDEAVDSAKFALLGLKRQIGAAVFKPLGDVIRAYNDWMRANRVVVRENIQKFFTGLNNVLRISIAAFSAVAKRVSELASAFGGLGSVAKIAVEALLAFAGAKILMGLGETFSKINNLSDLLKGFHAATIMGNIKAGLSFLALGAVVVLFVALMEDLFGFFQGKDSLVGRSIKFLQDVFKDLETGFSRFGGVVKSTIAILLTPIRMLAASLQMISGIVGTVAGGGGISDVIGVLKDSAKTWGGPLAKVMAGDGKDLTLGEATGGFNFGFGSAPTSSNQIAPGSNKNVSMSNQFNISVPQGTDPTVVGDRVYDATRDSMDAILRGANQSFKNPWEH